MKLAVLYAGQGAQHPGMGKEFYEASPAFRAAFDSAVLDFDLHRVCFEDPDGVLGQTQYTQPCMVAFACGVTAVLAEKGVQPAYTAGLSLGEYSALEAAGVFTAKQAIELAAYRGKAMADAANGIDCGMTAVLNLDRETLAQCCEQASALGCVQICNYNCPGQLVIGGEKAAVEQAAALAKAAGARRCIPLNVSGPFHTRLMKPAGDALADYFKTITFHPMALPVYFNCKGGPMEAGDAIPALLEKQVQSSVYWEDTVRRMEADGTLSPDDAATLRQMIARALEHPEVREWFGGGWERVRNENEIIIPGRGSTRRPDRVMIDGRRVVVVDYKFGLRDAERHRRQMREYLRLLGEMGYAPAEGYLWYVKLGKIEKVEP